MKVPQEIALAVCRALLGEVFPRLRAVCCRMESEKICMDFYVDGPIGDEDLESISCVETAIIADYHGLKDVAVRTIELPMPTRMTKGEDSMTIFRRREQVQGLVGEINKGSYFELAEGDVRIWLEQGSSIMLKSVTKFDDPVELSDRELSELREILRTLQEKLAD